MGKGLRAFCVYCDKEVREGDPFCRRCRRPTSWASQEQRAAWELEEWKNGRRPTLVPLPGKIEAIENEAEGRVVPMPPRPTEAVEEIYTPPAEYYQRAAGDDSAVAAEERPAVKASETAERVLTTAPLTPPTLEPVPNGNGNGNGNGHGNGPANGSGNGSNGSHDTVEEAAIVPTPVVTPTKPVVEEPTSVATPAQASPLSATSTEAPLTVPALVAPPVPAATHANGSPSASTPVNGSPSASTPANGSNGPGNGSNGANGSNGSASNGGSKPSTATPVLHPRTPGPTYPLVVGTREIELSSVEEKPAPKPVQTEPVPSERIAELVAQVRALKERVATLEARLNAVSTASRPVGEAPKPAAPVVQPEAMSAEDTELTARAKALTAYAMGAQPMTEPVEERGGFIAGLKRVLVGLIEIRD